MKKGILIAYEKKFKIEENEILLKLRVISVPLLLIEP